MPPKVSICIPAYQQTEFLRKNLESVCLQSFVDFEVILTDDSPTEVVKDLAEEFRDRLGNKFRYYHNQPALGSPENWNEGIRKSTGEWIKILHHDDWFTDKDSLEKFVEAGDRNKCPLVFSGSISFNHRDNIQRIHRPTTDFLNGLKDDPESLLLGNLIGSPSVAYYRRDLNLHFDKRLKWTVDFFFYIQGIRAAGSQFHFIDEPLIVSVNHAEHCVSNLCETPDVELFEYFYLYDQLRARVKDRGPVKERLKFFLRKYDIWSMGKLLAYYPDLKYPNDIRSLLVEAWLNTVYCKAKSFFNRGQKPVVKCC